MLGLILIGPWALGLVIGLAAAAASLMWRFWSRFRRSAIGGYTAAV